MSTEQLIGKYFNSWQEPADFDELASCLSSDFSIDAEFFTFSDRESFVQFLRANPTPWKDVTMISSIFAGDDASILYSGTNTATGQKMRVAEHIKCHDHKIIEIQTVIAQLN